MSESTHGSKVQSVVALICRLIDKVEITANEHWSRAGVVYLFEFVQEFWLKIFIDRSVDSGWCLWGHNCRLVSQLVKESFPEKQEQHDQLDQHCI